MDRTIASFKRLIAALTLVVAVFVAAPVIDAVTCAPESPVAAAEHVSSDHGPKGGDHGGAGADHAVCAHGHCHHGSSLRGEFIAAETLTLVGASDRPLMADPALASITPEGLMRPPKA